MVGNAGAYGESVSDSLLEVHLLEEGKEHVVEPDRLDFGYRTDAQVRGPDIVVLSAAFQLRHGHRDQLLRRIADDAALRRSKHPLEYASCGSYFKNPSREMPAARLIEDAGLKGLRVGRAHVSEKHANFLVAEPGATADDITALAAEVVRRVNETSGYELQRRGTPARLRLTARPLRPPPGGPPRYTSRVRSDEPARRHGRLSRWRKAIEELPHGLVDRLRRGQPEARAELFRRYAPQVRRILYLQGFCEEVDDAVQEVFIKVFRAKEIPREEAFLAWFYRVILNTGRDHGRRRKTRYGLMDKLQQISPETMVDAPAEPADEALRDALATLARRPARVRGAAVLRRPAAGRHRQGAGHPRGHRQVAPARRHEEAARGTRRERLRA